jgi:predicted negative regulator of RcsB-dependent stress response
VARISRKDLKKDEFREAFTHGGEAVASHQGLTAIILGGIAVIALAVFGWRYYAQHQTAQASTAMGEALRIFDARIRAAGEPTQPGEITYVDEKNKYEDAAKKFTGVADSYSRTRPGQQARYFDALCQIHLGRDAAAEAELTKLSDSGNDDVASLAKFQLASLDVKNGKSAQAIPLYQSLIANPTVLEPKPLVMLALADVYSKTSPAEATKLLTQIKTEFPNTPAADEATKRLENPAGQS